MSILSYFDNYDMKARKEHFLHLVQVANSDGVIDKTELKLLYTIGKKLGLTDPEIDELLKSKESKIFSPPYELDRRFHRLYNIVAMALADGVLYQHELSLIKRFAAACSFNDADSEKVINLLVNGIKYGKNWEELFVEFQKIK